MNLVNGFCELCRDMAIDLDALKAYYVPGDSTRARHIQCPNNQNQVAKNSLFFRFAEKFSADCTLCQMIWNAVRHDAEIPVMAIQLEAQQQEFEGAVQGVKRMVLSPIRNVSHRFGYRHYYPFSLLDVVPWHCKPEGKFPEGFREGTSGQLRVFTKPGKNSN